MTSGNASLTPLMTGLCLALATTVCLGGPALAAQKDAAPMPLQKLDAASPPALDIATPDSMLITPVSELQQAPVQSVAAPEVMEPKADPVKSKTEPAAEAVTEAMTSVTDLQNRHIQPVSFNKARAKGLKPVAYTTLPAIAIFPVIKHGKEKAFGDVPLMVAREFALKMERKAPETRILNPIYTVDEIRLRGLGHVYDKMMSYYIKTGRPEPLALDYLLSQLSADGRAVTRVMFVEADLDMGRPGDPTGAMDRFKGFMTDAVPKYMKYHVAGRVQVFDAGEPDCPMVWSFNRTKSVKVNEILNVTPSIYQDSDSQRAFAALSRELSRDVLLLMPRAAYMQPEYDLSVQGQIVGTSENAGRTPVSEKTRDAIERILGQGQ